MEAGDNPWLSGTTGRVWAYDKIASIEQTIPPLTSMDLSDTSVRNQKETPESEIGIEHMPLSLQNTGHSRMLQPGMQFV